MEDELEARWNEKSIERFGGIQMKLEALNTDISFGRSNSKARFRRTLELPS
jgi:hypothetical protein